MKTTTNKLGYNVERNISSPYADAKYAFGRVKVTYVEYISADNAFASDGPWPITSGYSAQLVSPSSLTKGKASWDMLRGSGDTTVEATRNLLDQVDSILRNMSAMIAETGN